MGQMRGALPSLHHSVVHVVRALRKIKHYAFPLVWNEISYGTGVHAPKFRDRVGTGMNRAKTDGLVREIVGLSACFQSVVVICDKPPVLTICFTEIFHVF